MKRLSVAFLSLAAFAASTSAWADAGPGSNGQHMNWMADGWSHGFFGFLMMLVFLAVLVFLAIAAFRALGGSSGHSAKDGGDGALETLRTRFAKGEIDGEEYKQRRELLEN